MFMIYKKLDQLCFVEKVKKCSVRNKKGEEMSFGYGHKWAHILELHIKEVALFESADLLGNRQCVC